MKKFDIKKIFANHVEKLVLGIVLVLVLVGFIGTKWVPYQKTPEQIKEKVDQGRKTLSQNKWPPAEEALHQFQAPAQVIHDRLRQPISTAPYELSNRMVAYPWDETDPVREPELLAVQDPEASASRVLLSVKGVEEEKQVAPEAAPTKPTTNPEDDIPDEFRRKNGTGVAATQGPGTSTYAQARSRERGQDFARMMSRAMQNGPGGFNAPPAGLDGSGGAGGPAVQQQHITLNGKGYHFVSVRGVFPLHEQIKQYAEAIHKGYTQAAEAFDIRDFHLQRQARRPDGTWSDWESVDLQVAGDILNKVTGFDADVVNSMITNSVITMPLPERITGLWKRQATHHRIEKFELSDEEMKYEVERQAQLLDKLSTEDRPQDEVTKKRGGFNKFTFDARQMAADALGARSMYDFPMAAVMAGVARGEVTGRLAGRGLNEVAARTKDATPEQREAELAKWIKERLDAAGELLLFRYLDFSVDPGMTYRYRVQLILANPNFGKPITTAGGFENVVQGETRETPWSQPTEPVTVDDDIKYFIAEVKEQVNHILPTVRFDVFEWDTKYGTTVNGKFDVRVGQRVADDVKTEVIDPLKSTVEETNYKFESEHYLVDVQEDYRLDNDFHEKADDGKSVTFPPGLPGRALLSTQTLVKSNTGDLRLVDSQVNADRERQEKIMEYQKELYKDLKSQAGPVSTDGLDKYLEMLGGGGPPGTGKKASKAGNQRFRNQLQKHTTR